jgi:hypothetical protein
MGHSEVERLHPLPRDDQGKLLYDVQLRGQSRGEGGCNPLLGQQQSLLGAVRLLHQNLLRLNIAYPGMAGLLWVMVARATPTEIV